MLLINNILCHYFQIYLISFFFSVTMSGPGACHYKPCLHDGRCVDATSNNDPDLHFDYDHEFKCFCTPHYSGRVCGGIYLFI